MPAFIAYTFRATRQVRHAAGFAGGCLLMESKKTFWTMTAWNHPTAMNAFRASGAHRSAMPKLLHWCDEASIVHWQQQDAELPSWKQAHLRMVEEGRLSKVHHPSPAQKENRIPAPRPGRLQNVLRPARHTHRAEGDFPA